MNKKIVQLSFDFWNEMLKKKDRSEREKEMDVLMFRRVRPRGLDKKSKKKL